MNTPVSFETAQLLKEKGFKEKTFHYYFYYEDSAEDRRLWPEKIGTAQLCTNTVSGASHKTAASAGFGGCDTHDYLYYSVGLDELLIDITDNPAEEIMYQAPTIAEVVMWLYEKHGIWIQVFILNKTFAWKLQDVNTLVITCLYSQQDKGYKSPTEGYEAAIIHVLNTIIK